MNAIHEVQIGQALALLLSGYPMIQGQVWGPQVGLPMPNFMHMSPSMNAVLQSVNLPSGGSTVRKKAWPCPQCGKSFSDQGALIYHKEAIHDRKVFQCQCGKVYKYRTGLIGHRKVCSVLAMGADNGGMNS